MAYINPECIFERAKLNFYMKFRIPRLYFFADRGHWDRIPARVKVRPDEIDFVHNYVPADTALHRLVRPLTTSAHVVGNCNESTDSTLASDSASEVAKTALEDDPIIAEWLRNGVQAILSARPSAALVVNAFGQTPLHLALQHSMVDSTRRDVALALLRAAPETASWVDSMGNTPLHYLVEHAALLPTELLNAIVVVEMEALDRRNENEKLLREIVGKKHPEWVEQLKVFQ